MARISKCVCMSVKNKMHTVSISICAYWNREVEKRWTCLDSLDFVYDSENS